VFLCQRIELAFVLTYSLLVQVLYLRFHILINCLFYFLTILFWIASFSYLSYFCIVYAIKLFETVLTESLDINNNIKTSAINNKSVAIGV